MNLKEWNLKIKGIDRIGFPFSYCLESPNVDYLRHDCCKILCDKVKIRNVTRERHKNSPLDFGESNGLYGTKTFEGNLFACYYFINQFLHGSKFMSTQGL